MLKWKDGKFPLAQPLYGTLLFGNPDFWRNPGSPNIRERRLGLSEVGQIRQNCFDVLLDSGTVIQPIRWHAVNDWSILYIQSNYKSMSLVSAVRYHIRKPVIGCI